MKVALCHHYSLTFQGGGERFLIDVANQLIKRGHYAAIYALPFGRRPINMEGLLHNIEYHENIMHNIGDADLAYFLYAPLVNNLFAGKMPKIAAIHSFVFLKDLQDTEIRTMNCSNFIRYFGFTRFISNLYFEKIAKKRLSHFNAIHVINKEALKLFDDLQRVYYVPNWIDSSYFKPEEGKKSKFTVLFTGRRTKGFSTFVEISNILGKKEIDFVAIGPDLESTKNVKYLGFISDTRKLIKIYSRVHVLVYTSKTDVFPMSLLEAASCKLPIIAIPTLAIRGLDLPIFYASSAYEFSRAITKLYSIWQKEEDKYMDISEKMREKAIEYDSNKIFPNFLNMLREVATCPEIC